MRFGLAVVAGLSALSAAALILAISAHSQSRARQQSAELCNLGSIKELRDAFNHDKRDDRLILLLSPT